MCVPVKNRRHRVSGKGLFQTTGAEERIDLERLAFDGVANWRIVDEGDPVLCLQPRERRLELEDFLERLVHELFDDRLAPRAQCTAPEATAEPTNASEPHAVDLVRVAVEQANAGVGEDLGDFRLLPR